MTSNLERRVYGFELRAAKQDEKPKLSGYAARFNDRSKDLGGWVEEIAPGAFSESITNDDIRCLWNHDSNFVLGRNRAKTLTLTEDERGLAIDNEPPDTQWARDLLVSIGRGDINEMSFAFEVIDRRWDDVNGVAVRTLTKVKLYEVSPVTFPAYNSTQIGLRSASEVLAEKANLLDEMKQELRNGRSVEDMKRRLDVLAKLS